MIHGRRGSGQGRCAVCCRTCIHIQLTTETWRHGENPQIQFRSGDQKWIQISWALLRDSVSPWFKSTRAKSVLLSLSTPGYASLLMSHPNGTKPPADSATQQNPNSSTDVFAVHGVEPEVQAYAMAKYSRSALSMKESLKEISEQKAEQFLNTFYFQYGHRSIADLAHLASAIEKLSILAAIILVDEQRWDGQERSTRYQNFKKSGYFIPDFGADAAARSDYCATIDFLFAEYEAFTQEMLRHYTSKIPRPEEMAEDQYTR